MTWAQEMSSLFLPVTALWQKAEPEETRPWVRGAEAEKTWSVEFILETVCIWLPPPSSTLEPAWTRLIVQVCPCWLTQPPLMAHFSLWDPNHFPSSIRSWLITLISPLGPGTRPCLCPSPSQSQPQNSFLLTVKLGLAWQSSSFLWEFFPESQDWAGFSLNTWLSPPVPGVTQVCFYCPFPSDWNLLQARVSLSNIWPHEITQVKNCPVNLLLNSWAIKNCEIVSRYCCLNH